MKLTPPTMNPNYEKLVLKKLMATEVKALRKSYNLTQAELADKLGVTQPYISEIERAYDLISINTYNRVIEFLNNYDE